MPSTKILTYQLRGLIKKFWANIAIWIVELWIY